MPHNDCHDPIAAATTDELLTELQKRFDEIGRAHV